VEGKYRRFSATPGPSRTNHVPHFPSDRIIGFGSGSAQASSVRTDGARPQGRPSSLGRYNDTEEWDSFPYSRLVELGLEDSIDVLTGTATLEDELWLAPYEARWIVIR
jgi:hypothetical protein